MASVATVIHCEGVRTLAKRIDDQLWICVRCGKRLDWLVPIEEVNPKEKHV